jgi:hypothetical protein
MSSLAAVAICAWTVAAYAFSQGPNPAPQPAVDAILSTFDRYDAVGMNAAHSHEKQDEFILTLIRHPGFALRVNDIVVGASLAYERTRETILSDQGYRSELSGRVGSIDVDALRRRNQDRALFTDRTEARQFAPGAEMVGTYVTKPGDEPTIVQSWAPYSTVTLLARFRG